MDVAAFLQRHGIEASFVTLPRLTGVSTGKMLLNRLSDLHANLLVMGAYGHPRADHARNDDRTGSDVALAAPPQGTSPRAIDGAHPEVRALLF